MNVECNFEGNKIIFFFTAEGRVDFRELVRDLASVFRARIELRQIGVRDEAKMLGGLGICGRPLCCSQFLDEFIPVSIKMAKTQNLSLNPTKISGTCGRLMCCLKYEQAAYEDAAKRVPKNDSFVDTPDGVGNVSGVDLLREQVQVRLDSAPESPKRYKSSEIRVLRSGKGSREGIEIPKERPTRTTPEEPDEALPASRFARRPGGQPAIPVVSVLAGEESGDEDRRNRRRRNRKPCEGKPRPPAAGQPARQPRPDAPRPPKAEKPQKPERGPRPDRPVRQPDRPVRAADKVEKLPVRSTADVTAEKKAAADRAARQQPAEGRAPDGKPPVNRRRPRRRPKGNE